MIESLTAAAVVETLIELDMVELDANGPWPGEPDGADVCEPDWSQVHPTQPDFSSVPVDMPEGVESVLGEVRRRAGAGFKVPPTPIIDALAWYTPIHYFGLGMAIYIQESAVLDVAAAIVNQSSHLSAKTKQILPAQAERRCESSICTRRSTTRSSPWRSATKSSSGQDVICPTSTES